MSDTETMTPPTRKVGQRFDGLERVRWTKEEQDAITEHAWALWLKGERSYKNMVHVAQETALPVERRRRLSNASKAKWFIPEIERRAAIERARRAGVAEGAEGAEGAATGAAGADEPAEALEPATRPLVSAKIHTARPRAAEAVAAAIAPTMAGSLSNLRTLLVDALASIVTEAVFKGLKDAGLNMQPRSKPEPAQAPASDPEDPEPASMPIPTEIRRAIDAQAMPKRPEKVVRPSVLVVGLKGSQKTLIDFEFSDILDLRFVSSDESKDQLRSQAGKAEHCILMTDFISHSHSEIVKARNSNVISQTGTMTRLRETLAHMRSQVSH